MDGKQLLAAALILVCCAASARANEAGPRRTAQPLASTRVQQTDATANMILSVRWTAVPIAPKTFNSGTNGRVAIGTRLRSKVSRTRAATAGVSAGYQQTFGSLPLHPGSQAQKLMLPERFLERQPVLVTAFSGREGLGSEPRLARNPELEGSGGLLFAFRKGF